MSSKEKVWTVVEMLKWGTDYFEEKGVPNARLSIEWLLSHTLDINRLDLYLQFGRPLTENELGKLKKIIKRRATHEPLQYITGTTEFMGCKIEVNPSVLIPRQETEQLVSIVLEDYPAEKEEAWHLLDIGTGSGCIPIAIKKSRPHWNCSGIDFSDEALSTAKKNADTNDCEIFWDKGDIFGLNRCELATTGNWHIVISNPPYILTSEKKSLEKQVLNYEPAEALFTDQPLTVYDHIIRFSSSKNSALYLECNPQNIDQVAKAAEEHFNSIEIRKDFDKKRRFLLAK